MNGKYIVNNETYTRVQQLGSYPSCCCKRAVSGVSEINYHSYLIQ